MRKVSNCPVGFSFPYKVFHRCSIILIQQKLGLSISFLLIFKTKVKRFLQRKLSKVFTCESSKTVNPTNFLGHTMYSVIGKNCNCVILFSTLYNVCCKVYGKIMCTSANYIISTANMSCRIRGSFVEWFIRFGAEQYCPENCRVYTSIFI